MGRVNNPTPSEKDSSRLVKDEENTYTTDRQQQQQQPAAVEFPPRMPQASPAQWPPTSAAPASYVVVAPPTQFPNQGPPATRVPNHQMPIRNNINNNNVGFVAMPTTPWNVGLFDCMDDPENALITLCFPCLTFGQIAEVLDQGQTTCQSSGMFYALLSIIFVPCLMSSPYRTRIRNKFGLIEDSGPDLFIHFFCEYCALCQEYRELQTRDLDPSIGWVANMMRQQHAAMVPPESNHMMR